MFTQTFRICFFIVLTGTRALLASADGDDVWKHLDDEAKKALFSSPTTSSHAPLHSEEDWLNFLLAHEMDLWVVDENSLNYELPKSESGLSGSYEESPDLEDSTVL